MNRIPIPLISSLLEGTILFLLLACRPSAASTATPTANFCGPGTEIERTVISGAVMGQGTTVAFAIPEGRLPTAVAILDQANVLVACSYIEQPLPVEGAIEVPLNPVGDGHLSGIAELSPAEGRYAGRLQIKLTTRGNDPFAPYWIVLVGQ